MTEAEEAREPNPEPTAVEELRTRLERLERAHRVQAKSFPLLVVFVLFVALAGDWWRTANLESDGLFIGDRTWSGAVASGEPFAQLWPREIAFREAGSEASRAVLGSTKWPDGDRPSCLQLNDRPGGNRVALYGFQDGGEIVLRDGQGRLRIKLSAKAEDGQPSIRVYDEAEKVSWEVP